MNKIGQNRLVFIGFHKTLKYLGKIRIDDYVSEVWFITRVGGCLSFNKDTNEAIITDLIKYCPEIIEQALDIYGGTKDKTFWKAKLIIEV